MRSATVIPVSDPEPWRTDDGFATAGAFVPELRQACHDIGFSSRKGHVDDRAKHSQPVHVASVRAFAQRRPDGGALQLVRRRRKR